MSENKLTTQDYKTAAQRVGVKSKSAHSYPNRGMFECPFHSDRSPSLSIDFEQNILNCFQCGYHGRIENLVYDRSGRSVEQVLGIIPDLDSLNHDDRSLPNDQEHIKNASSGQYSDNPRPLDIRCVVEPFYNNKRAQEYIKRRGITYNVAMRMQMGYVQEGYINGTWFADRLVIPIYDHNKRVINMEGRAIEKGDNILKCLYPKNATKPLYDYYNLDTEKPMYLFEGIIKMAVARTDDYFYNSSATLGSNITDYQMEQLNRFKHVVVMPDNDPAGDKMLLKIRENYGGALSVLRMADNRVKDADEIPTKLGISVKEYRENGGFISDFTYM